MTISKERFEQIALEVAKSEEIINSLPEYEFIYYAHALITAVEKEAEVVGYVTRGSGNDECANPLIALPLVEGE